MHARHAHMSACACTLWRNRAHCTLCRMCVVSTLSQCNNIRGLDMCSIISVLSCNELTFMCFSNTVLQNNSFEILVHFKFLFALPVKNSFLSKSKCLLSLKECFNFSKEKDFSLYSYENSQNILIPEKNCISSKKSRMYKTTLQFPEIKVAIVLFAMAIQQKPLIYMSRKFCLVHHFLLTYLSKPIVQYWIWTWWTNKQTSK